MSSSIEASLSAQADDYICDVDLGRNNLRLYQDRRSFRFGEDAVCLAHFAAESESLLQSEAGLSARRFCEVGAGGGVISLLLSALLPDCSGLCVELSSQQAAMLKNNIERNGLAERLQPMQADIAEIALCKPKWRGRCDFVLCNPPYRKASAKLPQFTDAYAEARYLARFDTCLDLPTLFRAATFLMSEAARFYLIFPLEREFDLLRAGAEQGCVLWQRRQIVARRGLPAKTALYAWVRGIESATTAGLPTGYGAEMSAVAAAAEMPPLILRETDGSYTAEAKMYYT